MLCGLHKNADGKSVWRGEQFLGLDQSTDYESAKTWQTSLDNEEQVAIVILDDGNLGFRDDPSLWPKAIKGAAPPKGCCAGGVIYLIADFESLAEHSR